MFKKERQKLENIKDFKEDSLQKNALFIDKGQNVEDVYLDYLAKTCWWMNEKWENKNVSQQVTLNYAEYYRIDLYNFSQVLLEDWHIAVLRSWLAYLFGFSVGRILEKIQCILINDKDELNPFTGEPKYGSINRDQKVIIVYPAGLSKENYRLGDISRWEGVLWYEIAHWLQPGLFDRCRWMERFDWVELEIPMIAAGGAELHWKCNQPEKCVDDYAKLDIMNDFAESFVAMCFCPELLDQEKFLYLSEKILMGKKVYPIQIDFRLREGRDMVYPFISQPLYYKWREPLKIVK